jgi:hypothetical protein
MIYGLSGAAKEIVNDDEQSKSLGPGEPKIASGFGLTSLTRSVAELITIRQWAIAVLATAPESASPLPNVSTIPTERWSLFLETDPCSGPLLAAITARKSAAGLTHAARVLLSDRARRDAERGMRAQRDGSRLAAITNALRVKAIILKGGVPTIHGETAALSLADLDVLVQESAVETFSIALQQERYVRSLPDAPNHSTWYDEGDRLPVELHWSLDWEGTALDESVFDRALPLNGLAGLWRLSAQDEIPYLLRHAVLFHPERPIRIRDAILIGAAATRLSAEDRDVVAADMRATPGGERMMELLGLADSLHSLGSNPPVDPFEKETAVYFIAEALRQKGARIRSSSQTAGLLWYAGVATRRISLPGMLRRLLRSSETRIGGLSRLQRSSPRVGTASTLVTRAAYYLGSVALGTAVVPLIRRLVWARLRHTAIAR